MKTIDIDNGEYRCCPLYKNRTNVVWYRGTETKNVDVLFIGEAPGKDEDIQGKPFVGRAGKLLDKWIAQCEITNYAIINIVKCRPLNNRKPHQSEIRACLPYLIKQIYEMKPKLIVALGAVPTSVLLSKKELIPNIGKIFRSKHGPILIFPHPAYVLRGADPYIPIEELKDAIMELKK